MLPKHPMAEAVNYALGQWEPLNVFCSDGAVPIDNNISEREMKRVVLNRNYVQFRIMRSAATSRERSGLFKGQNRNGSTDELSIIVVIFWGRKFIAQEIIMDKTVVAHPQLLSWLRESILDPHVATFLAYLRDRRYA